MLKKLFRLKKISFSLETQKAILGCLFSLPFLIGFFLFYLYPLFQSFLFSISELQITSSGYELNFTGLSNFHQAVLVDPEFNRVLLESIVMLVTDIPAVIIFSLFAAILVNQKFRGRLVARSIFFLPVIMTAGVILQMEQGDLMHEAFAISGSAGETFLGGEAITDFLWQMQLPEVFIEYIVNSVGKIPEIINLSAIPILIFLAGLQSIPDSLYESARIEGANSWDSFWKITFPVLTPLILTNVVFIIVYSFTYVNNEIIVYIEEAAWGNQGYGVSVAMSWIYFLIVMLILAIVGGYLSRKVVYLD